MKLQRYRNEVTSTQIDRNEVTIVQRDKKTAKKLKPTNQ